MRLPRFAIVASSSVVALMAATAVAYACCWCPPPPPPPTATPAPAITACELDGSGVVGNMPFQTQADWAPGQVSTAVINPGNYVVDGIATDANNNQYYRIVLSCQYLYVPLNSMQPSYDQPQNGAPLPTTPVT